MVGSTIEIACEIEIYGSFGVLPGKPAEGFVTGTGIEGYRDDTAFHAAEQTGFCKGPGKSFSAIQDREAFRSLSVSPAVRSDPF